VVTRHGRPGDGDLLLAVVAGLVVEVEHGVGLGQHVREAVAALVVCDDQPGVPGVVVAVGGDAPFGQGAGRAGLDGGVLVCFASGIRLGTHELVGAVGQGQNALGHGQRPLF